MTRKDQVHKLATTHFEILSKCLEFQLSARQFALIQILMQMHEGTEVEPYFQNEDGDLDMDKAVNLFPMPHDSIFRDIAELQKNGFLVGLKFNFLRS